MVSTFAVKGLEEMWISKSIKELSKKKCMEDLKNE